jgi:hypothetical protein
MSDNPLVVPTTAGDSNNALSQAPATSAAVDPYDFSDRYNTKLTAAQEQQYQQWVADQSKAQGRDLSKDTYDYDLRGFWKSGGSFDDESGHGGDTYKKPNHPTFSDQSQYHGVDGYQGGTWGGGQNGQPFTFTPSTTNLQMMSLPGLQRYFASPAEAGRSVLVVPTTQ